MENSIFHINHECIASFLCIESACAFQVNIHLWGVITFSLRVTSSSWPKVLFISQVFPRRKWVTGDLFVHFPRFLLGLQINIIPEFAKLPNKPIGWFQCPSHYLWISCLARVGRKEGQDESRCIGNTCFALLSHPPPLRKPSKAGFTAVRKVLKEVLENTPLFPLCWKSTYDLKETPKLWNFHGNDLVK